MKTKQIKIYRFKELKKDVQEKVLNKFRELEQFDYLYNMLKDELMNILHDREVLYREVEVLYSLAYCQGDGLCFTGIFETAKGTFKIEHTNAHYYHANSTTIHITGLKTNKEFRFDYEWSKKEEEKADKILKEFEEIYKNICWELEKYGYALMEDSLSESNLIEQIELNDYYFRANGDLENE